MKKNKETAKYLRRLDINFLEIMYKKIDETKRDHDAARDKISASINKVLNGDWGDSSQCMNRGELMVYLKISEHILTYSYLGLLKCQNELRERMAYLNDQNKLADTIKRDEKEENRLKKDKKKKKV